MFNQEEIDLSLAIQLQAQFEEELRGRLIKENDSKIKSLQVNGFKWSPKFKDLPEPEQEKFSVSLIDPSWELLDPNPNIHELFLTFNHQFFWGRLSGIEVKWSPRMTLCAGVCSYEGRSGLCSVRLSTPLLKLRPRKDLIETLLHEMIHAYLFVTHNNTDHDGHGPQFHNHMYRINKIAGTKISVYHNFHDEVDVYRQHIWQCNGPCKRKPPYYGLVKRSMNRAPSERDRWWSNHQQTCGGSYSKIKEPDGFGSKKGKLNSAQGSSLESSSFDIRNYFSSKENKQLNASKTSKGGTAVTKSNTNINGYKSAGTNNNIIPVNVSNATNSNVNGFGKSRNQTSSKSRTGNKSTTFGKKPTDSLATATTSGGSKTVVVKRKAPEEDFESAKVTNSTFTPFAGTGHTLSLPNNTSNGKSRLLSLNGNPSGRSSLTDKPKTEKKLSPTLQSNKNTLTSNLESCPMCHSQVASNNFEHHIEICIGDFFEDDEILFGDVNAGKCSGSLNSSTASNDTKNDSIIICEENDDSIKKTQNVKANSDGGLEIYEEFPCPICNLVFSQKDINRHAESHFS